MLGYLSRRLFLWLWPEEFGEPEERDVPRSPAVERRKKQSIEKRQFYGHVTLLHDDYGLVDNRILFNVDTIIGGGMLELGQSVRVLAVGSDDTTWNAEEVFPTEDWAHELVDHHSGDELLEDPTTEKLTGMVTELDGSKLVINQDHRLTIQPGTCDFAVVKGDWLSIDVRVSEDEEPIVTNISPLREHSTDGPITVLKQSYGIIDDQVYFDRSILGNGFIPKRGDTVACCAIESKQLSYTWRAISVVPTSKTLQKVSRPRTETETLDVPSRLDQELLKDKCGLKVTFWTDMGQIILDGSKDFKVHIWNSSAVTHVLTSVTIQDSQTKQFTCSIFDRPHSEKIALDYPIRPKQTILFSVRCNGRFIGKASSVIVFQFKDDFKIARIITATVVSKDHHLLESAVDDNRQVRLNRGVDKKTNENSHLIPGVQPRPRIQGRLPVHLPQYQVPTHLCRCIENENELLHLMPCLAEVLNEKNYAAKMHALLYLEEIEMEKEILEFSLENVSFKNYGEFMEMTIPNLNEGPHPVIAGDKVVVSYGADFHAPRFEGFVYEVTEDRALMKFHSSFHADYREDYLVNVDFQINRTPIRRAHLAVELASSSLLQILFAKTIRLGTPQLTYVEQTLHCHHCKDVERDTPEPDKLSDVSNDDSTSQHASATPEQSVRCENGTDGHVNVATGATEQDRTPRSEECECVCHSKQNKTTTTTKKKNDRRKVLRWKNCLNERQKEAVRNILSGIARPLPYVIFGPPGTGKTTTIVEAILHTYHLCPYSRILICTPSNSAVDHVVSCIHVSGMVDPSSMVRLNAFTRLPSSIPQLIRPYCHTADDIELLVRRRIVACTCMTSGMLLALGLHRGHFSHVFVDEAGQAMEPECILPMLFARHDGQIVLAGDPLQLGPVIRSNFAISYGLKVSLLQRLMESRLYVKNERFAQHSCYDPCLVTKLINSYRSHPAILDLPSSLFYDAELKSAGSKDMYSRFCQWSTLPRKDFPILFHGVKGESLREGGSPSWFNPAEVMQVILYLQQLYDEKVDPDDVGIITPYKKQIEKLRMMMTSLGLQPPKLGSVEEFQGQEKMVIILSTVRASQDDGVKHLGFLKDPRRFNVSITRAKALLIVVGDSEALGQDVYWRALIKYCLNGGNYVGWDLPNFEVDED